jgi:two-component system, NarL family, sensor kinase
VPDGRNFIAKLELWLSIPMIGSLLPLIGSKLQTKILIVILCGSIFLLTAFSSQEYVFEPLYIIPIIFANCHLGRKSGSRLNKLAIAVSALDFAIPYYFKRNELPINEWPAYIWANKLMVIMSLSFTYWLIHRIFLYIDTIGLQTDKISHQQDRLSAQTRLMEVREDFIHTLTHDLKTPLLGAIQTIKSFRKEQFGAINELQSRVLQTISQSQQNSLHLIETLLDIYRNDAQGLVLQPQSIDLWTIAKEAIDTAQLLSTEREIRLKLKTYLRSEQSIAVMADLLQLSRVFNNLIANAVYYSPRAGVVQIEIVRRDREYVVEITNWGEIIDPESMTLLFDRFHQVHQQVKGSGLGLYLSRQIIEAHGGRIWAESKLSEGTKFCFSLPLKT